MLDNTEGSLKQWFSSLKEELESAYVKHKNPWEQSGFYISEDAWIACRKPIADCVDKSGSFLDIGCANGYLLECIIKWVAERRLSIVPYGIDLSPKLIVIARERMPEYKDNFVTANGLFWENPVKFDFVRTELVYVPDEFRRDYIDRIVKHYLADNGRLLLTEYRSRSTPLDKSWADAELSSWGFTIAKQVSGWFDNRELNRVSVIIKQVDGGNKFF